MQTPKSIDLTQSDLEKIKENDDNVVSPTLGYSYQFFSSIKKHVQVTNYTKHVSLYTPVVEIDVREGNSTCSYSMYLTLTRFAKPPYLRGSFEFVDPMNKFVCYWRNKDLAIKFAQHLKSTLQCFKKSTHRIRVQEYTLDFSFGRAFYLEEPEQ